jgi:chemotaxis protein MotA
MDLGTIIGMVVGLGLIAGSILLDGSLMAFFNVPGLLIVVGGTFAATLVKAKMSFVFGAVKIAMKTIIDKQIPLERLVEQIHELSQTARKEGVLGMENVEVEHPFLERGVVMAIDGLEADFVVSQMTRELGELRRRHMRGQDIFRFMAGTAPSMGMIGTLIGLVNMLRALDDPASIGPAMAVALLTTFYGAVLAFLFFAPMAEKLGDRSSDEVLRGQLAIAGIEAIINGDNKNLVQTRLDVLLEPKARNLPGSES